MDPEEIRYWRVEGRYGYHAIDEVDKTEQVWKTVAVGLTRKVATQIAEAHNEAIDRLLKAIAR